jgi:hypothetical protein
MSYQTVEASAIDHSAGVEITDHAHERGQLSVVVRGTLAVTRAEGWWLTPPELAIWIAPNVSHGARYSKLSVFRQFLAIDCVRQTRPWFLEYGLQLPTCSPRGQIHWKRPYCGTVYQILTNPVNCGAYAYGKGECTVHYEAGEPLKRERRKPTN